MGRYYSPTSWERHDGESQEDYEERMQDQEDMIEYFDDWPCTSNVLELSKYKYLDNNKQKVLVVHPQAFVV